MRVFDRTAEMKAYEVTARVSEAEIFRICIGVGSYDLGCKASKLVAGRMGVLCRRR